MPFVAVMILVTLWMPFLVGDKNGPSQCAPRDSAPEEERRALPEGPRYGSAFSCQFCF